ncbi:MAG: ATP-dependent sacrificial sulfur transferase LarE [Desulfobacterales bacterium]|nr:ATP-dependent sacrificial sulfur transferase LarE [Desulfobacterales bacterium]MBF0397446.1 ATP-dependent sacrificial sulfur transferase LarE [Desulfobacterales bacterium]
MDLEKKKEELTLSLKALDSLLIGFSGGVDSTFLLAVAHQVLKEKVIAVTSSSPIHPSKEIKQAISFTKKFGIKHIIIESKEFEKIDFLSNEKDRCYICKRYFFEELEKIALNFNLKYIAHGANLDDLNDFRPGFKAAYEKGIIAPLIDAKLKKEDIRMLSKKMNLFTWNKPSMACLATRIPYGIPISIELLKKIEQAEDIILNIGIKTCRLRYHGQIARIEVMPEDFELLLKNRVILNTELKKFGFSYITIDLEGYKQGSLNSK